MRVLFVGESPPSGGTFFYDADSILHHATRDAFAAANPKLAHCDFLASFQQMGCYLDDLSLEPIDRLPRGEKNTARRAAIPGLMRRLNGLSPRVVVVVVKGIRPQVEQALAQAGLGHVPLRALRFPNSYWRTDYIAELAELMRDLRRRRVLGRIG